MLYITRGADQGSCSLPFPPQTYDFGVIVDCKSTYAEHFRSMETLNVSDALLPSAGPNPALFRVELKKGEVGFGFNISGGQEYGTQVAIGSIDDGGPADGLLKAGDEIFLVDGAEVIGATRDYVNVLVRKAESFGEVELAIHRNFARSELTEWEIKGKDRIPSTKKINNHNGIPAQRNSNVSESNLKQLMGVYRTFKSVECLIIPFL